MARLLLLLVALVAIFPARADAAIRLAERQCVLGAPASMSAGEAITARGKFDCGPDRFRLGAERIWVIADVGDLGIRGDGTVFKIALGFQEALIIHARSSTGATFERVLSGDELAKHWRASGHVSVPLTVADGRLETLLIGVDKPWRPMVLPRMSLTDADAEAAEHYHYALMFALFFGMMIAPVIYNLCYYGVLRQAFMPLHAAMSLCMLAAGLSWSGLLAIFVPGIAPQTSGAIYLASLAGATISGALFLERYLEPGMLSRRIVVLLRAASALLAVAALAVVLALGSGRPIGNAFYNLAFAPLYVLLLVALGQAVRRGSRAVRFMIAGWAGLIIIAGGRILRGIGVIDDYVFLDDALYFALAIDALITAIGIADRLMTLRRERDRAEARAEEFAVLAETDSLTGLLNRRAIEARYAAWKALGKKRALALIDVDHFKSLNDAHGHVTGDAVLSAIADALRAHCGDAAIAARIGGEEFVVLYPAGNPHALLGRLTALRTDISRQIERNVTECARRVTVSVGAAMLADEDFSAALGAADIQLYRAKRGGRDRVEFTGLEIPAAAADAAPASTLAA